MSKLKKVLLMCTAYVLVAALAIGGTIAYLTSTDSDVNVMTLGNVSIAQHEYERVVDADGNYEKITVTKADGSTQESYKLQEFTQAKPLYPAVGNPNGGYDPTYVRFEQLGDPNKVSGGQQFFADLENAQDKIVLVENTGKTDAYVRTIFAFEMGKFTDINEWHSVIMDCTGNNGEPWSYKYTGVINIDGNNFAVMEAIYTGYSYGNMRHNGGVLPAGEWTYNSLAEVYMTSDATNDDVEAIDGNGNGTYDVLVLSQAVQTAGFDDAKTALDTGFGKTADKAAEWFDGVIAEHSADTWDGTVDTAWYEETKDTFVINNAEQLAGLRKLVNEDKITFANKTVELAKDIDLAELDWEAIGHYGYSVFRGTFDGNGHTISNMHTSTYFGANSNIGTGLFGSVTDGCTIKDLTIKNARIWSAGYYGAGVVASVTGGDVAFENVAVEDSVICAGKHVGGIVGITGRTGVTQQANVTFSGCSMKNVEMVWVNANDATSNAIGTVGQANPVLNGLDSITEENVTVTKDRDLFYSYQVGVKP